MDVISRRRFINMLHSGLLVGLTSNSSANVENKQNMPATESSEHSQKPPRVGIALGAGGANGLAHILMLEALDEMSIRPYRISGSSIGSVIAALYASGMSGKQIREMVENFIISPRENLIEELLSKDITRWFEFVEIELGHGGLIDSEGFISFLYENIGQDSFEKLDIPLKIVAADLWDRSQVVLESGPLLPAIKSSMALPGVFQPVIHEGRVLIDGGTVL